MSWIPLHVWFHEVSLNHLNGDHNIPQLFHSLGPSRVHYFLLTQDVYSNCEKNSYILSIVIGSNLFGDQMNVMYVGVDPNQSF